jgi:four helix bundle protein
MAAIVQCVLAVKQPPELVGRAYRFSLAALRFYRKLPKSPDAQVPGVQFYKAAISTWSNYRASQRGRSRAEFIAKLGTATEESDEAVGWLEFMRDGAISSDDALLGEAREICAMLTASLTNARGNT